MRNLLIALLASAAIPASFAQSFTQRWNDNASQLKTVQAPIPSIELHAYALKLLRLRVVAKDDTDPCPAFTKQSLYRASCNPLSLSVADAIGTAATSAGPGDNK
jgi:hypothetical protein